MEVITVAAPEDQRLDDYRNLTDVELRRWVESRDGLFMAEGVLVVRRLLAGTNTVRSVLLTPARLADLGDDLTGTDAPVYAVTPEVMKAVAGFDIHRGALAAVERPSPRHAEAVGAASTRLAVLEGLNDHENLGSLFRSAAALGIDGVLLSPRCADPLYRRSVRVSMGAVLDLPFARLEPWPGGVASLHDAGYTVLALTPDGTETLADVGVPDRHDRVAVLVGAEGPGLSDGALALADHCVRIPMAGGMDSLNVAVAAAIAFEHLRPD